MLPQRRGPAIERIPCPQHHDLDRPFLGIVTRLREYDRNEGRLRPEFGETALNALDLNTRVGPEEF